ISAISFWAFDIGFDFQFLDVCYWFRLSVLGRLLLVSAFGSWAFVLVSFKVNELKLFLK
ncbi:hypothetical protein RhiirA1_486792, partial [Rhizophagus irregularis]